MLPAPELSSPLVMAKRDSDQERRLDKLYREHSERFVAARDEFAGELRSAGKREQANRVKALRRPTTAAWAINRAALSSTREVREFAEASRRLEEAQARALEEDDEGAAEWRAAVERENETRAAVAEAAERGARDAGHPISARTVELVGETLRAAVADPELRDRVLRGRLQREQSAATLGALPAAAPRKRDRRSAERRERARARRELARLEGQLADATQREERLRAQVERTAEALREEKRRLAGARREAAGLRRRVEKARRDPPR